MARAVVASLLALVIVGCGEQFAEGYIWASNQSDHDVLLRYLTESNSAQVWLVPAHTIGAPPLRATTGTLQALDPATCAVLVHHFPVSAGPTALEVTADGTAMIGEPADAPAQITGKPELREVGQCRSPS